MSEILKNKSYIKDTEVYILRWFITDTGKEYKGRISFDGDYNAYGENGNILFGKYFDEDGNEIIADTFNYDDVKSAVTFYKKYHSPFSFNDFKMENPKEFKDFINFLKKKGFTVISQRIILKEYIDEYSEWFFDYSFQDVI